MALKVATRVFKNELCYYYNYLKDKSEELSEISSEFIAGNLGDDGKTEILF